MHTFSTERKSLQHALQGNTKYQLKRPFPRFSWTAIIRKFHIYIFCHSLEKIILSMWNVYKFTAHTLTLLHDKIENKCLCTAFTVHSIVGKAYYYMGMGMSIAYIHIYQVPKGHIHTIYKHSTKLQFFLSCWSEKLNLVLSKFVICYRQEMWTTCMCVYVCARFIYDFVVWVKLSFRYLHAKLYDYLNFVGALMK